MNKDLYLTYKIISRHPAFVFSESFYKKNQKIDKKLYIEKTKPLIKKVLTKNENTLFYIHIPFCKSLCWYCYCFKEKNNDDEKHLKYLKYLEKELKILYSLNGNKKLKYHWINIWWWTPNILSDINFEYFFKILNSFFNIDLNKEINIDLHPSLLNRKKLNIIKNNCSRVSLWIQTFDLNLIKKLDRFSEKDDKYNLYIKYFQLNKIKTNIDLLIWLRWQSYEQVNETIKKVLKLKPSNISLNYFHKKDWLKYWITDKEIELISKIKSKRNNFVLNYNASQNTQINIESRLNNIVWIWVGAIGHIFSEISLFRNNFEKYYNSLDKKILHYDKYLKLNKSLEAIFYFLENIPFWINKKKFTELYWNLELQKIIHNLYLLFENNYLFDNWNYISSNLKNEEIIPIVTNLSLKEYKKDFYDEKNISEEEKNIANLDYKLFFENNWDIIDQLE